MSTHFINVHVDLGIPGLPVESRSFTFTPRDDALALKFADLVDHGFELFFTRLPNGKAMTAFKRPGGDPIASLVLPVEELVANETVFNVSMTNLINAGYEATHLETAHVDHPHETTDDEGFGGWSVDAPFTPLDYEGRD